MSKLVTPADAIRDALRSWLHWAAGNEHIERDYSSLTEAVLAGLRVKGFKIERMYEIIDTTR